MKFEYRISALIIQKLDYKREQTEVFAILKAIEPIAIMKPLLQRSVKFELLWL